MRAKSKQRKDMGVLRGVRREQRLYLWSLLTVFHEIVLSLLYPIHHIIWVPASFVLQTSPLSRSTRFHPICRPSSVYKIYAYCHQSQSHPHSNSNQNQDTEHTNLNPNPPTQRTKCATTSTTPPLPPTLTSLFSATVLDSSARSATPLSNGIHSTVLVLRLGFGQQKQVLSHE